MQAVFERDALLRELPRVTNVIEPRGTIPILRHVHLDVGTQAMILRATDLDMEVTAPCMGEIKSQGVTSVDGKVLTDLVKKCAPGAQIGLTLDKHGTRLKIVAGRSRFTLPALDPADFPTLEHDGGKESRTFIVDAKDLRAMLSAVRFAISTDETRYYLNGIFFHQDAEKLVGVSTDGHRLSAYAIDLPAGTDGMAGVILPRKLVAELLRALPKDGDVSLEVSPIRVAITWGEVRIVSKLITGTFPDYKRVIPTPEHRFVADRKRLIEAVERVSIVLDDKSTSINLVLDKDGIEIASQSQALGVAFDEMDALVEGPAIEIGVNYRYLLDELATIEADSVVVNYTDPSAPLLVRGDGEEAHRMVLMPMHTTSIPKELKEAA